MSINATPEYEKADARYRATTAPAEQLECLQEMLRLIPKHKSSEKAQSELKRKISTLKKKMAGGGRELRAHEDEGPIVVALVGKSIDVVVIRDRDEIEAGGARRGDHILGGPAAVRERRVHMHDAARS